MRRSAAAAVGALLTVAACGHGGGGAPATTSTAAGEYARAAAAANARVAAARAPWSTGTPDLASLKKGMVAIAEAKEGLDVALRSIRPPGPAAADVSRLLDADLALERALRDAAAAPTPADLTSREPRVLVAGRAALDAANAVRRDLGLPPVP